MCTKITTSDLIKNEFSRLKDICYLDHGGSALYADSQINNVMKDLKKNLYGNPHSTGDPSTTVEKLVNNIRFKILQHFNTGPEEYSVIFTSGATAALKTVAECFAWDADDRLNDGNKDGRVANCVCTFAYTQDNHTSVLGMRELAPPAVNLLCLTRDEARDALNDTRFSSTVKDDNSDRPANSLFVYPAQSNFSGSKYPLEWIETCRCGALDRYVDDNRTKSRWYVVLDAASYVSTNHLDLGRYTPDFVAISFYKMFGYPTGLGALLVRNSTGAPALSGKKYFGGGTVEVVLARNRHRVFKKNLHEKLEDGTIDFLSVIAVGHGLDALRALAGPMRAVATRTFALAAHLFDRMVGTRHGNGRPVFRVYADEAAYRREDEQGGVVNFNVLRADGGYVGYNEVKHVSDTRGIVLRVGRFCNPGASQAHLGHTDQELRRNQEVVGHVCGDHIDLIDGLPTGSVRVSFGYQSSESDADWLYNTLVIEFWQNDPVKPFNQRKITADQYDKMDLRVTRIFVYPIKSCGAFETDQWQLEPYGFLYDRNWAVVSESGECITQLEEPKLCLVSPSIDLQKGTLTLKYAANDDEVPMTLPLDANDKNDKKSGKICWGGSIEGIDCGEQVAAWLSWNLDRPGLRLIKCTGRNPPEINKYGNLDPKILAANQCQYLLMTVSTLKWLRQEMENDIMEIDEDNLLFRFRGNIVVSGDNLPAYAELSWENVDIGGVKFRFDSVCERCRMVNIDQDTSENYRKPLSVLAKHKRQGKNVFGIYLRRDDDDDDDTREKCKIRVGQQCIVLDENT